MSASKATAKRLGDLQLKITVSYRKNRTGRVREVTDFRVEIDTLLVATGTIAGKASQEWVEKNWHTVPGAVTMPAAMAGVWP